MAKRAGILSVTRRRMGNKLLNDEEVGIIKVQNLGSRSLQSMARRKEFQAGMAFVDGQWCSWIMMESLSQCMGTLGL